MNSLIGLIVQRVLLAAVALTLFVGNNGSLWLPMVGAAQQETVNGASGPIIIVYDENGVPSIQAATENDAQLGLGYVHARDRLWQMEWQRRLASGRTAEFLGKDGIDIDTLFRTVGLRRAAEATWARLKTHDRQPLEAYATGINQYLSRHGQQLPTEFGLLGITPEPWTAVDVLAFTKLFTWGNGTNWEKELLRAQLAELLGPERAAQLTPAYLADGPVVVPDGQKAAPTTQDEARHQQSAPESSALCNQQSALCTALLDLHGSVAAKTGIGADGRGSNTWVVSGARTTTGKPLLVSDPHLSAQSPALWYLARLSWGGHMVIGATVPGGPGVQIGHNGHITWGVSTINVDSQDLYVEQYNDRDEALYQNRWEPMRIVPETIKVKGQPDITLKVRITRHGPLISDALAASEQGDREMSGSNVSSLPPLLPLSSSGPERVFPTGLAVRWTGHDAKDAGALVTLAINRARNWDEFTQAFREYRAANQNYTYADTAGNIGYIAAGTIPIRAKGDGSLPALGWTGEYEWTGYVPWERLPKRFNPPEGYIVSANNKVIGDSYPYTISNSYAVPYRAERIVEMLAPLNKLKRSPDDMAAMQADVLALHARKLMPILLRTPPADEQSKQALGLLERWDFRATGDSAATAIFEAWYIRIAERLFADELIDVWPSYSKNLYFVGMATETALRENQPWCDDVSTPGAETCADTLQAALSDGLGDMTAAQGTANVTAWRWDKVHKALFSHQPLGGSQAGPLFNRSIANGGDRFTVNVASSFADWSDYNQRHAAQYRQIVDLADLDSSRWIVAPGQGGDPKKPHYDDMLERWQRVEYLPMR